MPPNKKGGKNYKKGKSADVEPELYDCEDGQMFGRVIKMLGGCNVRVYCNDDYERTCHIRGKMRKKVWIAPGDIVLISFRDVDPYAKKGAEKGDVCAKYDAKVLSRLKDRYPEINPKLFSMIETANIDSTKVRDDTDGFEFDDRAETESESESKSDVDESMRPANRLLQQRAAAAALNDDDDDFDIDDL